MPIADFKDWLELARARGFVESALTQTQASWLGYEERAEAEHISASEYLDQRMNSHPHELKREPDEKAPELYSLAAQSAHVREHGEGSLKALMLNNGMKIGQIRSKPAEEQTLKDASTNPYSPQWRGTAEARQAKIAGLIKSLGAAKTAAIAHAAQCTLDGSPLRLTALQKRFGA
ncbi:hypothetical protein [Bradyrhizobium genosp. P]|uniref:hypothetical protein n=1 Tax=Bradyrhizobium genosp. P TaxID=83641 RepID=UPI003CFA63C5